MTDNQIFETKRKEEIDKLARELQNLLPLVLSKHQFNTNKPGDLKAQELSLHAKIGGKHNTYLNITNDVITSPDQLVAMWFDGMIHYIETVDKGMEERRAAYNFQKLLTEDEDLLNYTVLFLKRTYWRKYYSISKVRPKPEEAEIWIGQKNATYGIMITPRFKNGNWENDVSEIRNFRKNYYTIEHILETGLVIPYREDIIAFSSINQYLSFFLNSMVRLSGSPYEMQIAEKYCEFVKASKNPYKIPLLIPELRYAGIETSHIYRLDFTIINPFTLQKQGFELSPWSTHGYIKGVKNKTQFEVNEEAKSNFEKEMRKHKEYFRKFNIFTLIYTYEDLKDTQAIFDEMKEFLIPKRENPQLLATALERLKTFKL